jgi:glycosyltransferase involved in cell wall biosynthesis
MNTNKPYFSVIICCFNSEKFIRETIDSVIKQTYSDWEIITVNDGSSDNTENIIKDYISKGVNINYFFQENRGFANARNKCLDLAKGEWIVIIDHDDICLPKRLEIQAAQIKMNPSSKLFFGDTIHFSENGDIKNQFSTIDFSKIELEKNKAANSLLKYGCFIDSEGVMFNKAAALEVGGFDERYSYISDYDFFVKMGRLYDFSYTKEDLSKWRVHLDQATNTMSDIYSIEYKSFITKNFLKKQNSFSTNYRLSILLFKLFVKRILGIR